MLNCIKGTKLICLVRERYIFLISVLRFDLLWISLLSYWKNMKSFSCIQIEVRCASCSVYSKETLKTLVMIHRLEHLCNPGCSQSTHTSYKHLRSVAAVHTRHISATLSTHERQLGLHSTWLTQQLAGCDCTARDWCNSWQAVTAPHLTDATADRLWLHRTWLTQQLAGCDCWLGSSSHCTQALGYL